MTRSREISLHPEDAQIIESARDVARRMNITNIQPRTITWVPRLPADQVLITNDQLWLSQKMMGHLSPDEWRPLIASGLAYYTGISRKTLSVALKNLLIPNTAAVIILLIILLRIFTITDSSATTLLVLTITGYTGWSVFWTTRFYRAWKKLRLQADKTTEALLGPNSLLQVLQKIQQSGLARRRKFSLAYPTIDERIKQIST